ncbi:hypothetical protein DAPPUDRAFT_235908 [Daphnia pulex]|uniref:Uncharacterized protein n=1 Tax=Daphnia pulex TaxID=6669 RepID=E9FZD4_DAPPU|nr:hypothetical protein DAPPUDRAFT_235908 [Daphnia pulex]|eukprot:EFX87282.1 hypothetical protein DAPPUDRAFT_235908 [Daphnia pulex]
MGTSFLHSAPVDCFHAGQKGLYPFARVVRKSQTAKLLGRKCAKPAEKNHEREKETNENPTHTKKSCDFLLMKSDCDAT